MSDVNANINISLDSGQALNQLRALQSQITQFNQSVIASNAAAAASQRQLTANLASQVAATKAFSTSFATVESSVSRLGRAIDKNKLSLGEYFRYGAAASGIFGNKMRETTEIMGLAEERAKKLQTQYVALGAAQNGMTRAMAIRPLELFNADAAIATQRQQIFNKLLNDGSTSLINWGKNTQWAGRQLMVGFSVPLTIFGGMAGKIFMDLEKQVVQFKRVYGDLNTTMGEKNAMVDQVKSLAAEFTKYGVTVNDTIALAGKAAATGATGADLIAQTTEATRLAALGQIDYQQALDATISLQTAFNISSKDLAETTDFLNAVENQTVTSLDDITQAIPLVAPVIRGLGGDVKDLAVFMTAMREGGISANEGANALKSGMASLINPTKAAREQLAKVGIDIDAILSKNKGDLRGLVTEFGAALGSLSKFERQQTLAKMFGKYQFARLGALFQNISKDGTQAARVIDLTAESAEKLASLSQGEFQQIEESVGVKFTAAVEKFKLAIAPIGEAFVKIATPIIEFATTIANKFNELPDGIKTFITYAVGIGGVLIPALVMLVGLFANFAGQVLKMGSSLRSLLGRSRGAADSFKYLTMEELEAQAAAASLEGQTTSLTSALNVQRSAVINLAKAYGSYVAAAGAAAANLPQGFRGPAGRAPRAMATGGFVAGSGNKDSEPALLMPGEFVVNKDAAQKYGPVLSAMNEGKLKGYAEGDRLSGVTSAAASHYAWASPSNLAESIRQLGSAVSDLAVDVFDLTEVNDEEYEVRKRNNVRLSEVAEQGGDLLTGGKSFAGTTMISDSEKNAMYQAVGIEGEAFSIDELKRQAELAASRRTQVDAKYSSHIDDLIAESDRWQQRIAGASDQTAIQIEYMKEQTRSGLVSANMQDRTAGMRLTAAEAEVAASRELAEIDQVLARRRAEGATEEQLVQEAQIAYKRALLSKAKEVASGPSGTGGGVLRDVATGRGGRSFLTRIFGSGESGRSFAYGGWGATKMLSAITGRSSRTPTSRTTRQANTTANAAVDAMEDSLRINSPSEVGAQVGDNLDEGVALGIERSASKPVSAAKSMASAVGTAARKEMGEQLDLFNQPTSPQQGALFDQTPYVGPRVMRPAPTGPSPQDIEDAYRMNDEFDRLKGETDKTGKEMGKFRKGLAGMGGKAMGAMFALDGLTLGLSMMDNNVGEFAQKIMPAAFAVQGIAAIMPMLANPVGIAIAAVTALGVGLWAWNKQTDDVRARGRQLADAMYGTTQSMQETAKFFERKTWEDKLSNLEIQSSGAEVPTSENIQQAQAYLDSDAGKTLFENVKATLDTLGSDKAAEALQNNLKRMMLAGAISPEMGSAIASQIGEQLGNQRVSFDAISNIVEVIGPNGENLTSTDSRLRILADITGDATNLTSAFETAGMTWDGSSWVAQVAMISKGEGTADIFADTAAQETINKLTAYQTELDRINVKWKEGKLTAAEYQEQVRSVFDLKDAVSYENMVKEAQRLYGDAFDDGPMDKMGQTMADSLMNSINQELGQQAGAEFLEGLRGEVESFNTSVNLLDPQRVREAVYELNQLGRVDEAEKLQGQYEAVMNLSLKISSGEIDPKAVANLVNNGLDPVEVLAKLSVQYDDPEAASIYSMAMGVLDPNSINMQIVLNYLETGNLDDAKRLVDIALRGEKVGIDFELETTILGQGSDEVEQIISKVEEFDRLAADKNTTANRLAKFASENFDMVKGQLDGWSKLSDVEQKKRVMFYIDAYLQLRQSFVDSGALEDTMSQLGGYVTDAMGGREGVTDAYASSGATNLTNNEFSQQESSSSGVSTPSTGSSSGGSDSQREKTWLEGLKETWKANAKLYETATAALKDIGKKRGTFFGLMQQLRTGTRVDMSGKNASVRKGYERIPEELLAQIGAGPEGVKRLKELLALSKKELAKLLKLYRKDLVSVSIDGMRAERAQNNQAFRAAEQLRGNVPGLNDNQRAKFNFDEDEIQQLTSDPEWVAAYRAALKLGTKATNAFLSETQMLLDVPLTLDQMLDKMQQKFSELEEVMEAGFKVQENPLRWATEDANEALEKQIDNNKKLIDQQKEIVDSKQDEIDKNQRLNDLDQQAIDDINYKIKGQQEMIDDLSREDQLRTRVADALSKELENMAKVEQQVRDTYQKRIDALDKIASINDYILQQGQSQLDVAKALSEGDIYAAAAAQQQMQKQQFDFAKEQQKNSLNTAMENEVNNLTTASGLTRKQVEDQIDSIREQSYQTSLKIRDIEDYIYNLKETQIEPLEERIYQRNLLNRTLQNEIYTINLNNIKPLEDANEQLQIQIDKNNEALEQALKQLTFAGMTREQWEQSKREQEQLAHSIASNANALMSAQAAYAKIRADLEAAAAAAKQINVPVPTSGGKGQEGVNNTPNKGATSSTSASSVTSTSWWQQAAAANNATLAAIRKRKYAGGMIEGFAAGSIVPGSGGMDSVPAMLTPGEFVVRKSSVNKYGKAFLEAMNQGSFQVPSMPRYATQGNSATIKPVITNNQSSISAPVYNTYSVNVNASSNATPDEIASVVMTKIKSIESSSIRRMSGY